MAYQQQGGMGNGPPGPGEHHGPQGTEYTLQGRSMDTNGQAGRRQLEVESGSATVWKRECC